MYSGVVDPDLRRNNLIFSKSLHEEEGKGALYSRNS